MSSHVADLTTTQLTGAATELRALADQLDGYLAGDAVWTDADTLRGQLLLALVHGQVGVIERLRASAVRRDRVVPLDDRRRI